VPETREVPAEQLEAGVLDRTSTQRRTFRRLPKDEVSSYLG
jgi:hypothetical protein